MSISCRLSVISRLAAASAIIWMYGTGWAWAGDGANLQTIQKIIGPPDGSDGFCKILNMNPCPQLPTVTQALLEAAGLGLSPPEMVAAQNSVSPGGNVYAGNAASPLVPVPFPFPLRATTSPALPDFLSTLTPLAFVRAGKGNHEVAGPGPANRNQGTAAGTPLYNPDADTFLYAVAVSTFGITQAPGGTSPDTLLLFYDDLERTNPNFLPGKTVAKFLIPLTVLSADQMTGKVSERQVAATLHFIPPTADCSASKVVGDFAGSGNLQTVKATDIALDCAVVFGPSPTSEQTHAIFQVAVPLLVTGACSPTPSSSDFCPSGASLLNTDPAYFYQAHNSGKQGPINTGLFTAFLFDDIFGVPAPATPPILGANGIAIGIAPAAGPFCTPVTCPPGTMPPPPPPGSIKFALCASLPRNGNGQALVPSVGAYYAISTAGETLLSAAVPGVSTSVCPRL
jgi:hypothetical protein